MPNLEVVVFELGEKQCELLLTGPCEVGRQKRNSESLFAPFPAEGRQRLVVARACEDYVSKQHALIEAIDSDRVRITNLSAVQPVYFDGPPGPALVPGEQREVGLPQLLRLGPPATGRLLRLYPAADCDPMASLPGATRAPGRPSDVPSGWIHQHEDMVKREEMIQWFGSIMNVLQADPASSPDFYTNVAKSLVEMVRLDTGRVLFFEEGKWTPRAEYLAPGRLVKPGRRPVQTVLQKVLADRRTFWGLPVSGSSEGLENVVASPILNRRGEVVGALYGHRELRSLTPGPREGSPITKLEAMVVEMLAQGVAAGLARMDEEVKTGKAIALFEQFFGRKLARQLAQMPGWEQPRQSNVTVLFCDIRGFTRISKKLAPQQTHDWVRDVLDMLSSCVLENDGVLVDYVGDEVMSMWGAPTEQPDHAARACQAVLDMLAGLDTINDKWGDLLSQIGESTDLTVGLNSGTAQVGNVGSQFKFKYGAQGPTVNIGSRVMNANKFFQSRVLMTRQTWEQVGVKETFASRRLGSVRVNNVDDAIELFEMQPPGSPDWPGWRDEYEKALALFEQKELRPAGRILAMWREHHAADQPALVLLSRSVNAMVDGVPPDHPVWVLKGK